MCKSDVVLPKAHQNNCSYVSSVDQLSDSLCKDLAWWAVTRRTSKIVKIGGWALAQDNTVSGNDHKWVRWGLTTEVNEPGWQIACCWQYRGYTKGTAGMDPRLIGRHSLFVTVLCTPTIHYNLISSQWLTHPLPPKQLVWINKIIAACQGSGGSGSSLQDGSPPPPASEALPLVNSASQPGQRGCSQS